MSCFRFLGFTSFDQVDRLTIPEYNLLMQAVRLRQVDLDYRNHLQAFLSFAVQAEKRVGKTSPDRSTGRSGSSMTTMWSSRRF